MIDDLNATDPRHRDYDAQRNDPTPEEIDQRAAEIRQRWSEYVHYKRAGIRVKPLEMVRVTIG